MLEIVTLEHNSDEWMDSRRGIPTASSFSKILTGTGKTSDQRRKYAAQLAATTYAKHSFEGFSTEWTERGHEIEPEAREYYAFTRGVDLIEHQYATNDTWQGLWMALCGASPDGLVDDGLLEVKCLSEAEHVLIHAYAQKHGRVEPKYVPQLQGQMLVFERPWVDILFYHPELPELCLRVDRDDEYCSLLVAGVNAVAEMRDEYMEVLQAA